MVRSGDKDGQERNDKIKGTIGVTESSKKEVQE